MCLKWLRLNQKSLEHPLINFDLPYDLFKANEIRLKFTEKLILPLR